MASRRARRLAAWSLTWRRLGEGVLQNGSIGLNPNGAQCVDIPNSYWERFGVGAWFGNACDWVGQGDGRRLWLPSRPGLRVLAGDVFVLGSSVNTPEGHVGLVLDGSMSPYVASEQNYPTGSPLHLCRRYVGDAAGFVRLR